MPNKRANGEVSHADWLCFIEKLKVALLDCGKHVGDVDVSDHLLVLVTQKIKDRVDRAQSRYAQDHHCARIYKMTSGDVSKATLVTALKNHGISHPMVMDFDGSAATVATTSERRHQRVLGLHNEVILGNKVAVQHVKTRMPWREVSKLIAQECRRSDYPEGRESRGHRWSGNPNDSGTRLRLIHIRSVTRAPSCGPEKRESPSKGNGGRRGSSVPPPLRKVSVRVPSKPRPKLHVAQVQKGGFGKGTP